MLRDIWRESSVGELLRGVEAKEEGRQEGRQEGMRALAAVALEGRLGELSAEVVAALSAVDDETLRAVVAHLATDSPAQVRQRLGLR